jgi:class 3 adenylate cyclase
MPLSLSLSLSLSLCVCPQLTSYLSPNVNLAARLETATHIYGVPILLSEQVLNLLSDELSSQCRMLDRIAVKGSSQVCTTVCRLSQLFAL